MSVIASLLVRALGLVGVSLSPFWGGAIVAGGIALAIGGAGLAVYNAGQTNAEAKCEAATLRGENDRLAQRLGEKDRQLAIISAIQKRDADRADTAEKRIRDNEGAISATPPNPAKCFTRDMARRVRDIR